MHFFDQPTSRHAMQYRLLLGLLLLFSYGSASACSEPDCPVGKTRIGTRCFSTKHTSDGGLDPSTDNDEEPGDSVAGERDSAAHRDRAPDSSSIADTSIPGNGDPISPQAPDAAPSAPDAAPSAPDAAPSAPDAAPSAPDAAPSASACIPTKEICNGKDDDCDMRVDEDATGGNLGLACDNGGQGQCALPGRYVCFGGEIICDAPPPDGLKNICGGSLCGADLSLKGTSCTVPDGDCVGTGVFECDPTAANNALRCRVSSRAPRNLLTDPGFELQSAYSVTPPWSNYKGAFISNDPHGGSKNVTVVADVQNGTTVATWNDVYQSFATTPNAMYKVEAWVKTSPNLLYGRLGARSNPDTSMELADNLGYSFGATTQYTYVSTRFTATKTRAEIYVGASSDKGTTSLMVDDLVVTRENACN